MRRLALASLLAAPLALGQPAPTPAPTPSWPLGTVFVWVDDDGRMHAVDQWEAVPVAMRDRVKATEMQTGPPPQEPTARRPIATARPTPTPTPTPTPKPDRRASLLNERDSILEELEAMDSASVDLDEQDLNARFEALQARLKEIDAELKK